MNQKRTKFTICKAVRDVLASPVFMPGVYTLAQIRERLVDYGTLTALELVGLELSRQIVKVKGWSHNGARGEATRWTKSALHLASPAPRLIHDEEAPKGPVTATLRRIEHKLDAVLKHRGLDPAAYE